MSIENMHIDTNTYTPIKIKYKNDWEENIYFYNLLNKFKIENSILFNDKNIMYKIFFRTFSKINMSFLDFSFVNNIFSYGIVRKISNVDKMHIYYSSKRTFNSPTDQFLYNTYFSIYEKFVSLYILFNPEFKDEEDKDYNKDMMKYFYKEIAKYKKLRFHNNIQILKITIYKWNNPNNLCNIINKIIRLVIKYFSFIYIDILDEVPGDRFDLFADNETFNLVYNNHIKIKQIIFSRDDTIIKDSINTDQYLLNIVTCCLKSKKYYHYNKLLYLFVIMIIIN